MFKLFVVVANSCHYTDIYFGIKFCMNEKKRRKTAINSFRFEAIKSNYTVYFEQLDSPTV